MSTLILTPQQISVSLENKGGELRLDSRIVADGFGLKNHKDYRNQVLEKYELELAELGGVLKTTLETGEIVWYLNQDQVNFAGTLARNTEKAVAFKLNLVKAFSIAKQIIPAQSERLQELEVELQLERERNKRIDRQDSMLLMHGRDVVLALNGCSEAIVREQVKVTEVVNLTTGSTDVFLSADQLKTEVQKRTGQKVKSLKAFTDEIRKAGRDDLLVAVTRAATSEYITPDRLDEAIGIVYGKSRQGLIGQ